MSILKSWKRLDSQLKSLGRMGGTGARKKEKREDSSGQLLGGGGGEIQEGEMHEMDTGLNCDPVVESELEGECVSYPAVSDEPFSSCKRFQDKLAKHKNAALSALKGWVRLEATKLLKLALPIVSRQPFSTVSSDYDQIWAYIQLYDCLVYRLRINLEHL